MWRRTYLLLVLVRLYFALSPSYLHPDENFQGPEVIAGQIFSYPVHLTWEFTSRHPIRSVFPLWPVYGLPMLLLHWVWSGGRDHHDISPAVVFWTLRALMFVLSFVLEDWAIHELVQSPRHRRVAVLLVASSYVTWTFQTHTFSNSVETLVVAWSLVLIQRIVENRRSSVLACSLLASLAVFGVFNRITFPAFLFIPGLRLFPHMARNPLSLITLITVGALTLTLAVCLDTSFYTPGRLTLSTFLHNPVITPLNNLLYNSDTMNLAAHGLHPYYQHFVVNLPQLLGPAYLLLVAFPRFTLPLASALSGIVVLSLVQHQEARFLIPTIPLILSSVRLPPRRYVRAWWTAWIGFNVVMGLLMGTYHQGGVVPTQLFLADQDDATQALWWRTYSPPIWLLNGKNTDLTTRDLMGMAPDKMMAQLRKTATCHGSPRAVNTTSGTYLIAPASSTMLDRFTPPPPGASEHGYYQAKDLADQDTPIYLERTWHYNSHLNLDDLDFGEDGIWPTLQRVVGRRGLTTWRVTKECT